MKTKVIIIALIILFIFLFIQKGSEGGLLGGQEKSDHNEHNDGRNWNTTEEQPRALKSSRTEQSGGNYPTYSDLESIVFEFDFDGLDPAELYTVKNALSFLQKSIKEQTGLDLDIQYDLIYKLSPEGLEALELEGEDQSGPMVPIPYMPLTALQYLQAICDMGAITYRLDINDQGEVVTVWILNLHHNWSIFLNLDDHSKWKDEVEVFIENNKGDLTRAEYLESIHDLKGNALIQHHKRFREYMQAVEQLEQE